MKKQDQEYCIDPAELEQQWGAPFVCRDQKTLDKATGGLLNHKTMCNLDSLGKGPKGRLRLGRKVGYPSGLFFEWFAARLKPAAEVGRAIGEEV